MTEDMRDALIHPVPADKSKKADPPGESSPEGRRRFNKKDLKAFHLLPIEKQIKICPVKPVGICDDVFYYIDGVKQLRCVEANQHSINKIRSLFVPYSEILPDLFPRYNKEGEVIGWKGDDAADFLMSACAKKGIWDPAYEERGIGAWRDKGGGLVLHCGDILLVCHPDGKEEWVEPGEHNGFIYPGSRAAPRPAAANRSAESAAVQELYGLLQKWNFAVGSDLGALLLIGWIGCAMIGGALDWRPSIWLMAKKGGGKSTLQRVIRAVLGDRGIIKTSDATEAGIRQILKTSTVAVSIDEAEAEEDNKKSSKMVALARISASGDMSLRGGEGHQARSFVIRSPFIFSSILPPPMEGADIDRILLLDILKNNGAAPDIDDVRLGAIGALLRRKMIGAWPYFRERFSEYREGLRRAGIDEARTLDQFGTLITCAACLLYEPAAEVYWDDETTDIMRRVHDIAVSVREENADETDRCLIKLMTTTVDTWRGGTKNTISELVDEVARSDKAYEADDLLQRNGIRIFRRRDDDGEQRLYFFIANQHDALRRIFEGTKWGAKGSTVGGWVRALRQKNLPSRRETVRCGKIPLRGTSFLLSDILPEGGPHVL